MRRVNHGHDSRAVRRKRRSGASGLSLIEILIGMSILVVGILGTMAMLGTGYTNVSEGGRLTMGLTAARQMLEDMRMLPFANLDSLHNLDTDSAGSQPTSDPARAIARKWRYALAGDGTGWSFTSAEKSSYKQLATGTALFKGRGQITVTQPSVTLREVTVTVTVPGRGNTVALTTLFTNM
jgi:type IV pilus modification protein PilV